MLTTVLLIGLAIWIVYKYWISAYSSWQDRGCPSITGHFPFGSAPQLIIRNKFQGEVIQEMYNKMASSPYFGIHILRVSYLVIRDPEIIRLIFVKDFSHFRDRQGFKTLESDTLANHLFNLEGERWRALRVKLSPTFTAGKLKGMFPLFITCAKAFDELLLSLVSSDINAKDLTSRFTTDVICSCAFGIELDTMNNADTKFWTITDRALKLNWYSQLRFFCLNLHDKMSDWVQFKFTSKEAKTFLLNVVRETVNQREKYGIKRNDFLDLLIQLKNKGTIGDDLKNEEEPVHPVEMTIELMVAQCFLFFGAGFETSSSVQTFCLYELALHPKIQERVQQEIDAVIERHGGLTYQAIMEMEYLDMVMSETMRKYPTIPTLQRRCTKPYTLPGGMRLEIGDRIIIPLYALQRDPNYFPDPEKFDPERFSKQKKDSIKPFTYMPFGEGSRNCIGMRFGSVQTKVGLITVLRKYCLEPSEKTEIPIKFRGSALVTSVRGSVQLRIVSRKLI